MRNILLNQTTSCHTNTHFRLKETNKQTWTVALPHQFYNLKLKLSGLIKLSTQAHRIYTKQLMFTITPAFDTWIPTAIVSRSNRAISWHRDTAEQGTAASLEQHPHRLDYQHAEKKTYFQHSFRLQLRRIY